ncbi:MAG: glycoside hydrolase family 9 protein, partial [Pirellulales bacterium]
MLRTSLLSHGCVLVVFAASASLARGEQSKPLAINGSFEEGQNEPLGWNRRAGGDWGNGMAHRGQRFARVESADERGWETGAVPLSPEADYRLECWIRTPSGEARLGIDLLDANGRLVRSVEAPGAEGVADWRYVAVEFKADAEQAKVWLSGEGPADFDDVTLAPAAISYIGNRDVQPDAKGRIGLWDEEKDDAVAPGQRAGTHRSDPTVKRRELPSLMVESTGAWYAVCSVNYGLPAFTDKIELSGWARADAGATAQIVACWMDDMQKVVRIDAGPETGGSDWHQLKFTLDAPPEGAHAVRLVALARGGRVWFDDFNLLHLRPGKPVLRLFVNQVGYELAGPKSAVVASNFFPSKGSTLDVQLIAVDGNPVLEKQVPCTGRIYGGRPDDWGWYFWRVDFSEWQQPGEYRLVSSDNDVRGESFPFSIERGAILSRTAADAVDFFFVQRCGYDVPGWHKACHLDDAKLPDGSHLDVTGGWHSAGDYNKPMWQFGD